MKKLKQCIWCSQMNHPMHVWMDTEPHYTPRISWLATWHYRDYKHGEGPHYFFSDATFIKELWRYLRKERPQRRKTHQAMWKLK